MVSIRDQIMNMLTYQIEQEDIKYATNGKVFIAPDRVGLWLDNIEQLIKEGMYTRLFER